MHSWVVLYRERALAWECSLFVALSVGYWTESTVQGLMGLAVALALFQLARRRWPAPSTDAALAVQARALAMCSALGVSPGADLGDCAATRDGEPGGRARGGLGGRNERSEGPPISEDAARLGRGDRDADELLRPAVAAGAKGGSTAARYLFQLGRWYAARAQFGLDLEESRFHLSATCLLIPTVTVAAFLTHNSSHPVRAHLVHEPGYVFSVVVFLLLWFVGICSQIHTYLRLHVGSAKALELFELGVRLYQLALIPGGPGADLSRSPINALLDRPSLPGTESSLTVVKILLGPTGSPPADMGPVLAVADSFLDRARQTLGADLPKGFSGLSAAIVLLYTPLLFFGILFPVVARAQALLRHV
ncbi:MAG: hypothetical protein HY815_22720 [Candidatus Riflebacteria bacterium]|nr:hypothetical protein [Candidatus Riflebacteria bacterium]